MKVPQISITEVKQILLRHGVSLDEKKVVILGIRGYYKNSMGRVGENDRNIYDDCLCVIGVDGTFQTFQANTDPAVYKLGIATLQVGIDEGRHGINFHFGGEKSTWSEGCQTVPKSSWLKFKKTIYALMEKFGQTKGTYLLIQY